MYLISESDLEKIKKRQMKIKDLKKPENIVLVTWTGEDVKMFLEQRELEIPADFEEAVLIVKKAMENCDCSMCVHCAIDYLEDELKLKKKK